MPNIPLGILDSFLTSSLRQLTESNPMKEKNIVPAAEKTASAPKGKNELLTTNQFTGFTTVAPEDLEK